MGFVDPVNAWFLRNTGAPLTPLPSNSNGGVGDVPYGPYTVVQTLEQNSVIGASSGKNPAGQAGLPQQERNRLLAENAKADAEARAQRLAKAREDAKARQAARTRELQMLRMEKIAQIEQSRTRATQAAAARSQARLRAMSSAQKAAQDRYRLSTSRASSAIPVSRDTVLDGLFRRRSEGGRNAITPEDIRREYGQLTTQSQVGPGFAIGRSTLKRDADGSRDGGQYYALAPRQYVTWGRPLYSQLSQYGYGLGKSRAEIKRLQENLILGGYMTGDDLKRFTVGTYDYTTARAVEAAMGEANVMGFSLEQMFAQSAGVAGGYGNAGDLPGGGRGPLRVKDVQKVYNITSLDSGAAVLRQVMARELGRQPTNSELKTYIAQLNSRERANPDIITTTSSSNASGSVTSSTQIKEGKRPEPDEEALRYAKAGAVGKEREQFQEASYYEELARLVGLE